MKAKTWLIVFLCSNVVQAQTAYRWVDLDGQVHYSDQLPPQSARDVQEKKLDAPVAGEELLPYAVRRATRDFPVTLYVSPDCGSGCKSGRDYLGKRGIPFSEKSVVMSEDAEALKKLLGEGELMVPVLTVGNKVSRGFLETTWSGLLDAAGYPKSP